MRTLMDKLPKKELHGQTPVVTYATKQALNQFEAQSKTRPTQGPPGVCLIVRYSRIIKLNELLTKWFQFLKLRISNIIEFFEQSK